MGWANCGTDDLGRLIGYAHPAKCDQPGCHAKIDRGLSYACGDMHGGGDHGCGRYFCGEHLHYEPVDEEEPDGKCVPICDRCAGHQVSLSREEIDNGNGVTSIEGISLKGSPGTHRRGALAWAHDPGCKCTPEQTFTCEHCGRRFGWCLGAFDDLPGACDFCWAEKTGGAS